jgi:hypothetical protein
MSGISPIPEIPVIDRAAFVDSSIKVATPDLIQIDEESLPIELITNLLFENVGGKELINISRNDIINGQRVSYNLIGNFSLVQRLYNPRNIFRLVGQSEEFFRNFKIKFPDRVPDQGTGPSKFYIGPEDFGGIEGFSVLDRRTDSIEATLPTFAEARKYIEINDTVRDIVYSDPETGNIVVDVTNMQKNELVQIEVERTGTLEDDTIY